MQITPLPRFILFEVIVSSIRFTMWNKILLKITFIVFIWSNSKTNDNIHMDFVKGKIQIYENLQIDHDLYFAVILEEIDFLIQNKVVNW